MGNRPRSILLAAATGIFTASSLEQTPDETAVRALYKQLETNTTRSVGSCTAAAEAMRSSRRRFFRPDRRFTSVLGRRAVAAFIGCTMLVGIGMIGIYGPSTNGLALEQLSD